MVEVHCFWEAGWIIVQIEADIKWLETSKWEVGCLQDASIRCLESANIIEQLDRAQVEWHMQAVEHADATIQRGHHL